MKKGFCIIAVILLLSFLPLVAFANDEHNPSHEGPGDSVGILGPEGVFNYVTELKLTDAQLNQLHAIKDSTKREVFADHNAMMLTIWDIQDEIKKESPDKAKLYSLSDKIADEQKKIARLRIDQMLQVKTILTPLQFKGLINMMDARKESMKKKIIERVIGDK